MPKKKGKRKGKGRGGGAAATGKVDGGKPASAADSTPAAMGAPAAPGARAAAAGGVAFDDHITRIGLKRATYSMLGKDEWWWGALHALLRHARPTDAASWISARRHAGSRRGLPQGALARLPRQLPAAAASGGCARQRASGVPRRTPQARCACRRQVRLQPELRPHRGPRRRDGVVLRLRMRGARVEGTRRLLRQVVDQLGTFVPELRGIKNSSRMMLTCYPGGGARYTKHCDNAVRNGRKLTALLYLNTDWVPAHGGQLRVYADDHKTTLRDIAPISSRLLLFFSDTRVVHEVLPTTVERFACTIWFFDDEELAAARREEESMTEAERKERDAKIQREIDGWDKKLGSGGDDKQAGKEVAHGGAGTRAKEVKVIPAQGPAEWVFQPRPGASDGGDSGQTDGTGSAHSGASPVDHPQLPSAEVEPQLPSAEVGPQLPSTEVGPQLPAAEVGPQLPSAVVGPQLSAAEVGPQLPAAEVGPQLPSAVVGPQLPAAEVGPQLPSAQVGPQLPSAVVGPQLPLAVVGPQLPAAEVGRPSAPPVAALGASVFASSGSEPDSDDG